MRRLFMQVLVLLASVIFIMPTAQAITVDLGGYTGPITFSLTDWTYGRSYTISTNGTTTYDPTGDTHGFLPASTNVLTDGVYKNAGPAATDTWGVVNVNTILDKDGNILWAAGFSGGGQYITGVVDNLKDVYIKTNTDGTFTVQQVGGILDLYVETQNDFTDNLNADPITFGTKAAYLADFVDGTHFLHFDLAAGIVPGAFTPDGTAITKNETTSGFTSPFTGQTSFYADVDPTIGQGSQWVRNYLAVDVSGDGVNDAFRSLFAQIQFDGQDKRFFDAKSSDLNDSAVPEPATILLLGAGLIGIGAFARKRSK